MVIADISGYTDYLQGVELDHAQDVMSDLMTAIVTPLRSHFRLNKLEGDAAFLYAPPEDVDGSVLLDLVEGSYFGFRGRVRSIERASTCKCGACSLIPRLGLKIIVHHGTLAHQSVLGLDELAGPDVILIHRLLKNDVEEATGTEAYALFTEAAVRAAGLEPELLDMLPFQTEVPDVGRTNAWVHDLDRAWRKEQARRRVYVDPEDSIFSVEQFMPGVSPGRAWEWMTRPERRMRFELGIDKVLEVAGAARRDVGTQTHCVHGQDAITEEVLDWHPPQYVTYKGTFAGGQPFILTDEVIETPEGVLVRKNFRAASAEKRAELELVLDEFKPQIVRWLPLLANLLSERSAENTPMAEVELPEPDEAARLASPVMP